MVHHEGRHVLTKERHDTLALLHFGDRLRDRSSNTLADKRGGEPATE